MTAFSETLSRSCFRPFSVSTAPLVVQEGLLERLQAADGSAAFPGEVGPGRSLHLLQTAQHPQQLLTGKLTPPKPNTRKKHEITFEEVRKGWPSAQNTLQRANADEDKSLPAPGI